MDAEPTPPPHPLTTAPRGLVVCSTVAEHPEHQGGPFETASRPCGMCGQALWVTTATLKRVEDGDLPNATLACEDCARMRLRFIQDQDQDIELVLPQGPDRAVLERHTRMSLEALGHLYARHSLGVEHLAPRKDKA